jgi:hypothetical protein
MLTRDPVRDTESVREYRIKSLGLVVGLSRRGVRVRWLRRREKDQDAYQTPLDWVRYCESVRRR